MGRIGIQRLIKVPSIYSTIEIGAFPGPTSICASWNVREPFASHARIRSPHAFLYSLNAKCWRPANLTSASSSLRTFKAGRSNCTAEQLDFHLPLPRDRSLQYLPLPSISLSAPACWYQLRAHESQGHATLPE
jgi:hypothetical protein